MEKRHRCKLCFRNFANGRALGGHMRSHMMKFYDEAEQKHKEHHFRPVNSVSSTSISQSLFSPSSSSSEEEESQELDKAVMADHDFYAELQDRESETESSRKKANRVRQRSNRVSRSRGSDLKGFFQVKKRSKLGGEEDEKRKNSYEQSSLSSISDTTPEEHVARCLIMLSRDKWTRAEVEFQVPEDSDEDFAGTKNFGTDCDYSESSGVGKIIKAKLRGKYKCDECNKLFKSYQALGGHRASHKKARVESPAPAPVTSTPKSGGGSAAAAVEKLHECPFCHRVFTSGQALGGHKRSHFIGQGAVSGNANSTSPVKQKPRNGEVLDIDLNLPAPVEDDESSQVAISAVSDAV